MLRYLVSIRSFASKAEKEISSYFNENSIRSEILKRFPAAYQETIQKHPGAVYVADQSAVNPGPCILTECLLSHLQSIRLFLIEENPFFEATQTKLLHSKPGINSVSENTIIKDCHNIWNSKTLKFIQSRIETRLWNDPQIVAQLFFFIHEYGVVHKLIYDVIEQQRLFSKGRIELFALLPTLQYKRLTSGPQFGYQLYMHTSCMFQLFFECELLNKISMKQILPWRKKEKIAAVYKNVDYDPNSLYLIRITPRSDIFFHCSQDDMLPLKFFVSQCFFKRTAFIIPKFEQAPGIGQALITYIPNEQKKFDQQNVSIDMFTQFGTLTPSQILFLFNFFKKSSHYNNSPFHHLYMKKTEKLQ